MSTIPALTPEMRQALDESGGLPIQVTDPQTQKIYLLMEQGTTDKTYDEYVRRELDKGLADIDAGRIVAWDPERIKREGRERLAARGIQPSKAD